MRCLQKKLRKLILQYYLMNRNLLTLVKTQKVQMNQQIIKLLRMQGPNPQLKALQLNLHTGVLMLNLRMVVNYPRSKAILTRT